VFISSLSAETAGKTITQQVFCAVLYGRIIQINTYNKQLLNRL